MSGLLGEIENETTEIMGSIFEAHKQIDLDIITHIFAGVRRNKKKFLTKALEYFNELTPDTKIASWESIGKRIRSLSGELTARSTLPIPQTETILSQSDIQELANRRATHGSGRLATLIDKLEMQDWVSRGRKFAEQSDPKCPYCQTDVPHDLKKELAEYFQDGYDLSLQKSMDIKNRANATTRLLEKELSSLELAVENDDQVDSAEITAAISAIRTSTELIASKLNEKTNNPTKSISVTDVKDLVQALIELVQIENNAIAAHNRIVNNAHTERRKLMLDGWTKFLSEEPVHTSLKIYNGKMTSLKKKWSL